MTDDTRVFEFKALDVGHEHWAIAAIPCRCGGGWEKGSQRLVTGDDGPLDEWDVLCGSCGQRAVFRFDVSAFLGHKAKVEAWLAQLLPDADDRVRGRLARRIGPEFGVKFRSLVLGLVNDGDVTTLMYLHWQIERAIGEMQQRAATDRPQ